MLKIFGENPDWIRTLKNTAFVVIGSIILAFGFGIFILPFQLVTGGVSGLSVVIDGVFKIEWITVDIYVAVLTWTLFLIGLIVLGKAFAMKTLVSSIVYPIALSLFMKLPESGFLGGFFDLTTHGDGIAMATIAAVFGGVIVGAGCALTFRGGASTGGLDIIALICAKYIKKVSSATFVFLFDALVVVVGVFHFQDMVKCLLGITSAFVGALVIDKLFIGEGPALIAHIVSDKYEEINRAVIEKLDRTTTVIEAEGGYSGVKKKMLMVSFTMSQYAAFISMIKSIDKDAFVTVHRAHELIGEGWTKYDLKKQEADQPAAQNASDSVGADEGGAE